MGSSQAKTKLVSDLAEKIHARISSGAYQPGFRLRQETLAREFEVSRTPVREALRQLEARGLISQTHRHSAVVCAPSSRDVRETYQVRAELEGLAAQLAAAWITDSELRELREIHGRFVSAVKELAAHNVSAARSRRPQAGVPKKVAAAAAAWIDANAQFHRTIHEAAGNLRLCRVIEDLALGHIRSIMLSSILGMDSHRMQQNISHHEQILEQLERRDSAGARQAMVQHIRESGEFVVRCLERGNSAEQAE
jgi:DNA-binding GntR family transcriptional regulator